MGSHAPVIVWFRQDLRLADNPALIAAHETGRPILPLYILDDINSGGWKMGAASRWWLHQSLTALNASLDGHLHVVAGDATVILPALIAETGGDTVFWNRAYEPWRIARDTKIKDALTSAGIAAKSFNALVLFEPPTVKKGDGTPYKVFTPFFRKGCLAGPPPRGVLPAPKGLNLLAGPSSQLDALGLLPKIPWYKTMEDVWQPGEDGAKKQLATFLDDGLNGYGAGRDVPAAPHVSRLSPHLHFGEVSPHQAWQAVQMVMADGAHESDGWKFLSEIGWREFAHYLLYHFPQLPEKNLQAKFDTFPWRDDPAALKAWQRGQTGVPMVDAGMRELWQTGYMHNRVRMITGSFLVKNLLLHWHHGAAWFWDTLVDADLANNSAGWQWIAGCGADAAPYFRVFNPVTQGQKFDPSGDYVRRFVPEIAGLPDQYLHAPWEAPAALLRAAGITLGETYPQPIVDLKASRERALEAFATTKG